MCPRPEYLRVRRLMDESLRRFSDHGSNALTEELENELLIALSQVFRGVKQLIDEYGSDEELLGDPVSDAECLIDAAGHLVDRNCLVEITGNLMFLLATSSQYVQHLVGNILVAISEFLLISGCDWDAFMKLLCLCLELAICNILKSSPFSVSGDQYFDLNQSTRSSLKLKLKSASWSLVAAISRVLRNIQKYLKQDFDDECLKAYVDCVSSLLINFPWDILRESYVDHSNEALKGSAKGTLLKIEVVQPREIAMCFGSFVQLLCSLVTLSGRLEAGEFSPVICRITNLVPKLTSWCHVDLQSPYHIRMSHYFRHKVLMLMIKLSSSMDIGQITNMTWIHILHKYFEDLLLQPISGGKLNQDDFLEGSPFCTSIFDPVKHNIQSCHLQRVAILLLLKCSQNSVGTKGSIAGQQFMHENLKQYCSADLNLDSECGSNNTCLPELHKWLQSHVPPHIHNDELYFERCVSFTLSFLKLFMHEDDILFEVLLQLSNMLSSQGHQIIEEESLAEAKNHLVGDLFNPIHLFHLFLNEINYDHQVLLDYLISKDTGSSCAEYLLRSLRIICNSWSLFVEFPGLKDDFGQLCVKRQKVSADSRYFKGEYYPASSKEGGIAIEECKESHVHSNESCVNYKLPFVAAGDCLASLTTSIESLDKKGLFPYNPRVLLRRLMKFQELFVKQ